MVAGHKPEDRNHSASPRTEGGTSTSDAVASPAQANLASYSKAADVYFFASDHESNYPANISKITARGGTMIAVAGGMEHNFAYWVQSRPDKVVLYDVNLWAIKLAKAKCELLLNCGSYEEFSQRFDRIFKGREEFKFTSISADDVHELVLAGTKIARTAVFLTPNCGCDNGWDKPEQFKILKQIIASSNIEYVHGDILSANFRNNRDVSLIFVSDIFGISANQERRAGFVGNLKEQQRRGNIREDAQIIDGASERQVLPVKGYA